jgi:16S rRNA (cytidine1402-2'-O)-methyltransferase
MQKGSFTICASHIGNVIDLPFRSIESIKKADYIIAEIPDSFLEDMNKLDIKLNAEIFGYNTDEQDSNFYNNILLKINDGKNFIFICQNGLPGFADPGMKLFKFLIDNNIEINIIPGPSIVQTLLCSSGLPDYANGFIAYSCFNVPDKEIKRFLNSIKNIEFYLILLDFPNKIKERVKMMYEIFNDNREASICINVSLPNQKILRGKYSDLILNDDLNNIVGLTSIVSTGSKIVPLAGIEPATHGLEVHRSVH